ncbi:MAG: metallophosphoesterase, partial [Candidatus Poribacteria bacterium]
MPDISWLHLSDVHTRAGSGDHLWPAVRKALFEDLPRVHRLCGGWDLVLFTGDMAFSGQEEQYDTLNDRLDELWELFEQLGSSPTMYAVPGNHDLVWPDQESAAVRTLIQPDQYRLAREGLFTAGEPDCRRAIDGA